MSRGVEVGISRNTKDISPKISVGEPVKTVRTVIVLLMLP